MRAALASLFLATLLVSGAHAFDVPQKPQGFVNDYAGVLNPETKSYLESELARFSASTTHEIAIVTIPEIGSRDTIETLSIRIADTWKVGKEKADNGIIFIIAPNDRQARIEVGYGLEGIMPDIVANRILNDDVFPKFKAGDYDGGIIAGAERIMQVASGEIVIHEEKSASAGFSANVLEPLLVFLFAILVGLAEYLARTRTWWQGGVLGLVVGFIAGMVFFSGIGIFIFSIILGLLGLLIDFILSRHGPFRGGGPVSWGGFGGGGFRGGSSGGFGGFGGGGFGGGGSSGRW